MACLRQELIRSLFFCFVFTVFGLPLSLSASVDSTLLKLSESSGKVFSSQKGRIAWTDMNSFLAKGAPIPEEELKDAFGPIELKALIGMSPDPVRVSRENITVPFNYTGCVTYNPFSQSLDGSEIYWQSCLADGHDGLKSSMQLRRLPKAVNHNFDERPVVSIPLKAVCGRNATAAHWLTPGQQGVVRCLPTESLVFWWVSFPNVLIKTIHDSRHAPPFAVATSTNHKSIVYLYRQTASAQIANLEVRAFNKTSSEWHTPWKRVRTTIKGVAIGFKQYEAVVEDGLSETDVNYMVAWTKETARMIRISPEEALATEVAPPMTAVLAHNTTAHLSYVVKDTEAHLKMAFVNDTGIYQQQVVFDRAATSHHANTQYAKKNQEPAEVEHKNTHLADWPTLETYNLLALAYPVPWEDGFLYVKDQLKRGIALLSVKPDPSDVKFSHYWRYPYLENGEIQRGHGRFRAIFSNTLVNYQAVRYPDVACRISKPVFTLYSQGQYTVNAVVKTMAALEESYLEVDNENKDDICQIGVILDIPQLSQPRDGEEWPPQSSMEPDVKISARDVCPGSQALEWGDILVTHGKKYVVGTVKCRNGQTNMWAIAVNGSIQTTLPLALLNHMEDVDTVRLAPLTTKVIPSEFTLIGTDSDTGSSIVYGFSFSRKGNRSLSIRKSFGPYLVDPKAANVDCPLHNVQHFVSTHPNFNEVTGICKKPNSKNAYWITLHITEWAAELKLRKVLDFSGRMIEYNSILAFNGKRLLGMSRKGDVYHITEYRDSLFKVFRVANELQTIFLTSPVSLTRLIFQSENRDIIPRHLTAVGRNEFFWVDQVQRTLWQNYRGRPLEEQLVEKVLESFSPGHNFGNMVRMVFSGSTYSTCHTGLFNDKESGNVSVALVGLRSDIALVKRIEGVSEESAPSYTVESSVNYGEPKLKGYIQTDSDMSRGNPFDLATSKNGRLTVWTVPGAFAAYASDADDDFVLMKLTFNDKPTGVEMIDRPEDNKIDVYIGTNEINGRIIRLSYDTSPKKYRAPNLRFKDIKSITFAQHRVRRFSVLPMGGAWPMFFLAPSSNEFPWVHVAQVGKLLTKKDALPIPLLPASQPVRFVQALNATVVHTDGREPEQVPLVAAVYEQDPIGAEFNDFRRTIVSLHVSTEKPAYDFHYRVILPLTADDISLYEADIRLLVDDSKPVKATIDMKKDDGTSVNTTTQKDLEKGHKNDALKQPDNSSSSMSNKTTGDHPSGGDQPVLSDDSKKPSTSKKTGKDKPGQKQQSREHKV